MALKTCLYSLDFSYIRSPQKPPVAFGGFKSSLCRRNIHCLGRKQEDVLTALSRKSAHYMPSTWDYDFIQSLGEFNESAMLGRSRVEELKEGVRGLFEETWDQPVDQLELIDTVQTLGLGYLFEEEIKAALEAQSSITYEEIETDLHATALRFRLLRQHGFDVPEDVFKSYMDGGRTFKSSYCKDIKGILSLYEASHLSMEGEAILDAAKAFTSKHLKCQKRKLGPLLQRKVGHALEVPLHLRMPRSDIRWAIDTYEADVGKNPVLLELAKLDFNRVQAIHQADVRKMSRWWNDLGLGRKLSFSRDRLMECFYMAVGLVSEPQFQYCRQVLTKVTQMITTIDDLYDIYGSLDELELFTEAVDKWDIRAADRFPYHMRLCFLALYNTTNEIAYDTLKEQDMDIMPDLTKAWADFCKAMLVEAKWHNQRYQPSLQEYLDNGSISSSGGVILAHGFFLFGQKISEEALGCFVNDLDIIRWPSMMIRLCNDLASSKAESERGDVPTSIQCYMHEAGVPEAVAREHIRGLIADTWKKMNKGCGPRSSIFHKQFIRLAFNLARMINNVYLYGDGHSVPDHIVQNRITTLLIEPISHS